MDGHARAAENLGLKPAPVAARAQNAVDQQFHRVDAIFQVV
jgi:hypothetical protein